MDIKNTQTEVTFADNSGLPATINGVAAKHRFVLLVSTTDYFVLDALSDDVIL